MPNPANTDHPVHQFIAERWSPRAFSNRPIDRKTLRSLFEAARWAPSCFNEQPWAYIVETSEDETGFERILSCLLPGNQVWAKNAPVLALSVAKLCFDRNGKENKAALHDLGLAAGNLLLEATARNIVVHQMLGIDPDRARDVYRIPQGWQPFTALALGYEGSPEQLPDELKKMEAETRSRKALDEFVFSGAFGTQAQLLRNR